MNQEKDGRKVLFYDTYALYAIATGENTYKGFTGGYTIITTIMNLYELYYTLMRDNNLELAENFFNRLISSCVEINSEHIKKAAKFRFKEIKRKLSYLDCLGYIVAKSHNVKFLTGDDGFKTLPNVKFVK
ncbi:PIN domain-containing protein [Candidatus Pacearchaeota archaeon]|nr:PIN domain-containing protein [Candidatus Pacearchaeota archaeon]